MKCLQTGMKREAVQEERSRGKDSSGGPTKDNQSNGVNKAGVEDQPESTCTYSDMPLDRILEAQMKSDKAGENPEQHQNHHHEFNATGGDPNSSIFAQIIEFAKNLPLFPDLSLDTQVKIPWKRFLMNLTKFIYYMKMIFFFRSR